MEAQEVTRWRGPESRFHRSLRELQETSWRLSRQIIEMTTRAGSGHPSSSLSAIDIMTALYFGGFLRYDPQRPNLPQRDRFILSKGHAAPALYAVLAEAGYFEPELLSTLRTLGSPLEGHPNMRRVPGVEASTGSLGQGLSIGVGHALATRLDGYDSRVYVIIGDGESEEGQVWEAALAAASYELDHLTAILDHNKFQQTGPVSKIAPAMDPIAAKWRAFGWHVTESNGHNMEHILQALDGALGVTGQPQMIIAHTKKGKGLSVFEENAENRRHGEALSPQEAEIALAELDELRQAGELAIEYPKEDWE